MGMERSLAFTALLDLSETFGKVEARAGSEVITAFVRDYNDQPVTAILPTMYSYAKTWLADHNDLVCLECGALYGQQHVWGCDLVLHGDVALVDGKPPTVTLEDCEDL